MRSVTRLVPVAVLSMLVAGGCGGPEHTAGSTEAEEVAAVVTGINDVVEDQEAFQQLFVSGSAPEDPSAYGQYGYEVVGMPEISGDQATVNMKVFGGMAGSQSGDSAENSEGGAQQEGEVTWTLQKEGESWKIKDAPLP